MDQPNRSFDSTAKRYRKTFGLIDLKPQSTSLDVLREAINTGIKGGIEGDRSLSVRKLKDRFDLVKLWIENNKPALPLVEATWLIVYENQVKESFDEYKWQKRLRSVKVATEKAAKDAINVYLQFDQDKLEKLNILQNVNDAKLVNIRNNDTKYVIDDLHDLQLNSVKNNLDDFEKKYGFSIGLEKGVKDAFVERLIKHWTNFFSAKEEIKSEYGIESAEDFIKALGQKAVSLLKDTKVWVSCPLDVLDKIIESGRFKSLFETGTSSGTPDKKKRAESEEKSFGYPKDVDPQIRPIYGYVGRTDDPRTVIGGYGYVTFRFKDTIKDRTTVTVGDSLNNDKVLYILYNKPNATMFELNDRNPLGYDIRSDDPNAFVEAQMHGGVKLSDLDAVYFTNSKQPPSQEQINTLNGLGLEVWIGSHEKGLYCTRYTKQ